MMKKRLILLITILVFILCSCGLLMNESEKVVKGHDIPKGFLPEINSPTVGIMWNQKASNTNVNKFFAGSQDGTAVLDPCVIKIDGIYHMWFTGVQSISGTKYYKIRYVSSSDGITWNNSNPFNDVVAPDDATGDELGVRVGAVIWDAEEEEFKMWYRGLHREPGGADDQWRYFYASSKYPDKGWLKYPNNATQVGLPPEPVHEGDIFFDRQLGDLCVIKERYYDGINYFSFYKMWYAGLGDKNPLSATPQWRISYATSNDGYKWNRETKPVLSPVAVRFDSGAKEMPVVLKDLKNGRYIYKLWYVGKADPTDLDGFLGLAYSQSGKRFSYFKQSYYAPPTGGPEVFHLEEAPALAQDPWVIRDGYVYKMWYVNPTLNCISFIESW